MLSTVYFWDSMRNRSNNINFKNKYCYEIADIQTGTNEEKVNAITYIINQGTDSYKKRVEAEEKFLCVNYVFGKFRIRIIK